MNNNSIAVVTGANGFVGSHLVDLLLSKNYSVRCITRKTSDLKWLKGKPVEIYDCGLVNKEGLRLAFKDAGYIYHVAGIVKAKKPEDYFKGNVDTTRALLETALEHKESIKKFLFVSSGTAAGPSPDGKPVTEDMEAKPITTYGRSKLAAEELVKAYMDRLPATICRAAAVYGERDTEILIFFKTYSRRLLTTIGFDKKLVSLIHVEDLIRGLYMAAMSEKSAGEIYFITSQKPCSWEEVGEATSKVIPKKPFKIKVPHPAVYGIAGIAQFFAMFSSKPATLNIEKARDITQKAWISSPDKAFKDFSFLQEISLEQGIKKTIEWYRQVKWI